MCDTGKETDIKYMHSTHVVYKVNFSIFNNNVCRLKLALIPCDYYKSVLKV